MRTLCLVFDGPKELLLERMSSKNPNAFENAVTLEAQIAKTQWPKRTEGWNAIVYINTFGKPGAQHLEEYL